jgi:hypothetical protein
MFGLVPARTKDGVGIIQVQVSPELLVATDLLRNMKKAFPQEWRQINYEILPPTPAAGIVGADGAVVESPVRDSIETLGDEVSQPTKLGDVLAEAINKQSDAINAAT